MRPEFRSKIFDDGTYVDVEFEKMIVQLLEDNGFNLTDSFEIEVFKQDQANTTKYDQLKFLPKQRKIVDGFLTFKYIPRITFSSLSENKLSLA